MKSLGTEVTPPKSAGGADTVVSHPAYPVKHETFQLDFANDVDEIQRAFETSHRTTVLASESDVNKLDAEDEAYRNVQANEDPVNARVESERALSKVTFRLIADVTQLFKEIQDNNSFKHWLAKAVFDVTYRMGAA